MNPLNVYCSACLAVPSEPCTSCGAVYGEPCLKVSGAMSMYPHRSRLGSTRAGAEVTWTK